MAQVTVKLTESDIRQILSDYILEKYKVDLPPENLHIQVKSKQNYRSEWEIADIKLEVEISLP